MRLCERSPESHPLPALKFYKQNMQRFALRVHAYSENLTGPFQTENHQNNQKLVKKMSKT